MRKSRANMHCVERAPGSAIRTLVVSQHEAVRHQLVEYLRRSPALMVNGEAFAPETIVRDRPDVLVLDLSRIGHGGLGQAIVAARCVGAQVIALASMSEPADERAVVAAGGIYFLKSAGPGGLAELVHDVGARQASPAAACVERDSRSNEAAVGRQRPRPTPAQAAASAR